MSLMWQQTVFHLPRQNTTVRPKNILIGSFSLPTFSLFYTILLKKPKHIFDKFVKFRSLTET